jgi:hypothetical protein
MPRTKSWSWKKEFWFKMDVKKNVLWSKVHVENENENGDSRDLVIPKLNHMVIIFETLKACVVPYSQIIYEECLWMFSHNYRYQRPMEDSTHAQKEQMSSRLLAFFFRSCTKNFFDNARWVFLRREVFFMKHSAFFVTFCLSIILGSNQPVCDFKHKPLFMNTSSIRWDDGSFSCCELKKHFDNWWEVFGQKSSGCSWSHPGVIGKDAYDKTFGSG